MYIYLIVNSATEKYYVGQHKGNNLRQYLQKKFYDAAHNRGGSSHLYASMRKYPKDVWSIHPLTSVATKAELDYWETFFIALFKARDPNHGYNICKGGEGFTGIPWNKGKTGLLSAEARAKISAARKLQVFSPASILKGANTRRGRPGHAFTDAERLHSSLSRLGKNPNPTIPALRSRKCRATKRELGVSWAEGKQERRKKSPEEARSTAEKNRGQKRSTESRERMSLAHRGKRAPLSELTKMKISEKRKAFWARKKKAIL
jgi:hypothetical protein